MIASAAGPKEDAVTVKLGMFTDAISSMELLARDVMRAFSRARG